MMKRLLFVFSLIVVLTTTGFSQWTQSPFGKDIDSLKANSGAHGVAVAPDGKIWIAPYRPLVKDSVFIADSNKWFSVNPVLVYNPDGTPASFSPIKTYKDANGKTQALYFGASTGITRDFRGNMLLAQYWQVVKFNYKTGEPMGLYKSEAALTPVACDTLGNTYVSHTLTGHPIVILDSTLAFVGNAVDTLPDIGRALLVSKDGMTIYAPRFTASTCYVYQKANEFDTYHKMPDVFVGWKVEALTWNPGNNLLYASAGSYNDKPTGAYSPSQQDKFVTVGTYYGVRTSDYKVIDSLAWKYAEPIRLGDKGERNRGIAFSNDGKTAYLVQFNVSDLPLLQRYVTTSLPSDVKRENSAVVENYSLSQNYPNPFNPSTEIKFSIAKDGFVSLKVFDILGKEVATLANGQMTKGSYSVRVDGQNLSSGIYIYQLNANGVMLSRKMTLMK